MSAPALQAADATADDARQPSTPAPSSSSTPAAGEAKVLCEGKARIPFTGDEGVFYNKVQVFNRDLSILVITAFLHRRQREWTAAQLKRTRYPPRHPTQFPPSPSSPSLSSEAQPDSNFPSSPPPSSTPSPAAGGSKVPMPMDADPSSPPSPTPAPYPGLRILEALSATGLRSIRYYLEIPSISSLLVNDVDRAAVASIRANIAFNGLPPSIVRPSHSDAKALMYRHLQPPEAQFDVIDLDPYGSAVDFLDAAVQSVAHGGLLAVTCTDKAVLCGAWGEVAYAKYGGYALKGKTCHETAIRLVLAALQSAAARYRRYVEPLLSLSIDFYVRVFVRVWEGQAQVKGVASRSAVVYQCTGCEAHYLQRMGRVLSTHPGADVGAGQVKHSAAHGPPCPQRCPDCHSAFRLGGPMWADALHDPAFIDEALASLAADPTRLSTHGRLQAMLGVARKELPCPLYYSLAGLCHTLHCIQPKIWVVRAGLIHAGYECSDTHALPDGIKTTAPASVVWDVMRGYVKAHPEVKGKKVTPDSPAGIILSKEPSSALSTRTARQRG